MAMIIESTEQAFEILERNATEEQGNAISYLQGCINTSKDISRILTKKTKQCSACHQLDSGGGFSPAKCPAGITGNDQLSIRSR